MHEILGAILSKRFPLPSSCTSDPFPFPSGGRELSNPLSVSSAKRIDHIFPKRVPISVSFLLPCRYFKAFSSYLYPKFPLVHATQADLGNLHFFRRELLFLLLSKGPLALLSIAPLMKKEGVKIPPSLLSIVLHLSAPRL